jgi:ribosomal protein S18 acetylase RimI-like enzyme
MKPVADFTEVLVALQSVKKHAVDFQTNFFPSAEKIKRWIKEGSFFQIQIGDVYFFLRRVPSFYYTMFFSPSTDALQAGLLEVRTIVKEDLVAEIVGKGGEGDSVMACYINSGFSYYRTLQRMSRAPCLEDAGMLFEEYLEIAALDDTAELFAFILRIFDPYSDNKPTPSELEEAVCKKHVWIARWKGRVAALLYVEPAGKAAQIRYWAVDENLRDQGLGGALMRKLIREMYPRRIYLWVISTNSDAIAKYRHYGFQPDGMEARIMLLRKKPQNG